MPKIPKKKSFTDNSATSPHSTTHAPLTLGWTEEELFFLQTAKICLVMIFDNRLYFSNTSVSQTLL